MAHVIVRLCVYKKQHRQSWYQAWYDGVGAVARVAPISLRNHQVCQCAVVVCVASCRGRVPTLPVWPVPDMAILATLCHNSDTVTTLCHWTGSLSTCTELAWHLQPNVELQMPKLSNISTTHFYYISIHAVCTYAIEIIMLQKYFLLGLKFKPLEV